MRNIVFHSKALSRIQKQILWYRFNYSEKSVRTMSRNLHKDFSMLAYMPTIGKLYKIINGKQFYIFSSKRKADIIYTFDEKTLYITDIIFIL